MPSARPSVRYASVKGNLRNQGSWPGRLCRKIAHMNVLPREWDVATARFQFFFELGRQIPRKPPIAFFLAPGSHDEIARGVSLARHLDSIPDTNRPRDHLITPAANSTAFPAKQDRRQDRRHRSAGSTTSFRMRPACFRSPHPDPFSVSADWMEGLPSRPLLAPHQKSSASRVPRVALLDRSSGPGSTLTAAE